MREQIPAQSPEMSAFVTNVRQGASKGALVRGKKGDPCGVAAGDDHQFEVAVVPCVASQRERQTYRTTGQSSDWTNHDGIARGNEPHGNKVRADMGPCGWSRNFDRKRRRADRVVAVDCSEPKTRNRAARSGSYPGKGRLDAGLSVRGLL